MTKDSVRMPLALKKEKLKRNVLYFLEIRPFKEKYLGYPEFIYVDEGMTLHSLIHNLSPGRIKRPLIGRKYLNRIGTNGNTRNYLPSRFSDVKYFFQKFSQGFSDKELWNLDMTMIELFYERLYRFKEITHADLEHEDNSITYKGEKVLLSTLIDKELELGEYLIKDWVEGPSFEVTDKKEKEFWEIAGALIPHLVD